MIEKMAVPSQSRMMTIGQVLEMWPVSRQVLWRLSNSRSEAKRLPSYKVGGKRLYKYDELMWYLDKHKTMPSEKPTPRRSIK